LTFLGACFPLESLSKAFEKDPVPPLLDGTLHQSVVLEDSTGACRCTPYWLVHDCIGRICSRVVKVADVYVIGPYLQANLAI
jgi:hypothetical protein